MRYAAGTLRQPQELTLETVDETLKRIMQGLRIRQDEDAPKDTEAREGPDVEVKLRATLARDSKVTKPTTKPYTLFARKFKEWSIKGRDGVIYVPQAIESDDQQQQDDHYSGQ